MTPLLAQRSCDGQPRVRKEQATLSGVPSLSCHFPVLQVHGPHGTKLCTQVQDRGGDAGRIYKYGACPRPGSFSRPHLDDIHSMLTHACSWVCVYTVPSTGGARARMRQAGQRCEPQVRPSQAFQRGRPGCCWRGSMIEDDGERHTPLPDGVVRLSQQEDRRLIPSVSPPPPAPLRFAPHLGRGRWHETSIRRWSCQS